MVFFSVVSETETLPSMATKKPRPLHNHSFFFPGLRWSNQHILPRMEFDPKTKMSSSTSPKPPLLYPQPDPSFTRNQDHLLHAIPSDVCKKSVSIKETSAANGKEEALKLGSSPRYLPITQQNQVKHSRRATVAAAKRAQQKFSVSLTKEETEEDLFAMKGLKLPRRTNKRPKVVKQQLDVRNFAFGLW